MNRRLRIVTTKFGFVSTYPPTLCGLATFTAALRGAMTQGGMTNAGDVVRLLDVPQPPSSDPAVIGDLVAGDPAGALRAARLLQHSDVAIVQHEYGVYGGRDGDHALLLLAALTVPTIVVMHTVLSSPTPHQKSVLEEVARLADAVVTMTDTARGRLADGYAVDMSKVSVIAHGAPPVRVNHSPLFRSARPTVLTWGLIGPGKGIEWGIQAMASLTDLELRYVVAGQTHPKVLLHEGEAYRDRLREQVRTLGLGNTVTLDSQYRHQAALAELVDSADIVLLPYDSTDQVTSGVLIEAVAALKPVVATRFPHAIELLGGGAGVLVPQQDPAAMAAALRHLITNREMTAGMTRAAGASAPELMWPAVAARYRQLADELIRARVAA
jgi:glycosyltransferase involved in cell wall biosynthesis